jgi:hypothetical protein
VNTVKISGQAKIGPIIHDEPHRVSHMLLQLPRLFQHDSRVPGLITVLKKSTSRAGQVLSQGHQFQSRAPTGRVHNGIKSRKQNHAAKSRNILCSPGRHRPGLRAARNDGPLNRTSLPAWENEGVRPYLCPFFFRNRSMKPVSIFPARKSGSASILR